MKPQCRKCDYYEYRYSSDEKYCNHPVADGEEIWFYYPQQRRPAWCPLMTGRRGLKNSIDKEGVLTEWANTKSVRK